MEQLERIKYAIWYDYLCGRFNYNEACDVLTVLLVAKNALLKEVVK